MIIAADTSPLVALSGIGQLRLLKAFFGETFIPPAVHGEIVLRGQGWIEAEGVQLAISEGRWLKKWTEPFAIIDECSGRLGAGEVEAVSLARHLGSSCLLDERRGRLFATNCGIPVVGSLGVILRAKREGLVTAVLPLIEGMRRNGIFFSDELILSVLAVCDE